jgi:hypothetical protein
MRVKTAPKISCQAMNVEGLPYAEGQFTYNKGVMRSQRRIALDTFNIHNAHRSSIPNDS